MASRQYSTVVVAGIVAKYIAVGIAAPLLKGAELGERQYRRLIALRKN
jgi:hypothetical protein